ncbi:uncharacterized protein SCHCODRAFT_02501466 [Schizophyllum commune H4-8]|uniref:uncharacterized protein n=1 Tax=Schizophyllum commune (strain H4-8 / FGSC 9210) TaxID=578458 RepID=UPI00215E094B|nr:uncharacterized protein SCHCODRAFT_02501466 [Schizophyllum commune H4-8]KAI5894310.1 hypothetical protein SCHCODRAFT_02501466 [Schizophyllum commune H4-8]
MNFPRSPMKAHARRSWTGDNTGFASPSYAAGTPQPVLGTPHMPVHGTPRLPVQGTPYLPVHGTPHMPVHGTPRHHVGTPYYPDHRQLDSFQFGHPRASPGMVSNKSFDYSPYSQASDLRGGFSPAYSELPVIPAGSARRRSHSFTTPAGGGFSPASLPMGTPAVPMGPVFSPFDGAYPPTPFPPTPGAHPVTPSAYPTTPGVYPSTPSGYPTTPGGYPSTPGVYPTTSRHSRRMYDFAIARDSGYEGADYRRGRRSSSVFQGPSPGYQAASPAYHRGRRSSSAHQGRPSSMHRGRSSSAHRGRSPSAHRGRSSSAHHARSSSALRGRSSSAHPAARGHRRSASAVTFAYPEATYIAPGMFSNTIKFRVKHAEESGIRLRDILRDDFRVSGKYTYRVHSNSLRDMKIEWPGYPSANYRVEFRSNSMGNLNLRSLARSLGESCKLYFKANPVPFDWKEARLYCIRDTGGLWKVSLH